MKLPKNKAVVLAISLLLTLSLVFSAAYAIPPPGTKITTYPYISVGPDPIGVGQTVTVNFFLSIHLIMGSFPKNMTVKITDPDGNTETRGPFTGDATGGSFFNFVPDEAGEWEFQFFYGGQMDAVGPYDVEYLSSTSDVYTLTVQEEPIYRTGYPTTPLPTRYWETPVSAQNVQEWYKIMGSWLGTGGNTFALTGAYNGSTYWNPYTDSVLAGHILWTKPWAPGGVVGGDAGGTEDTGHYWATRQYWPQYAPVIMHGKMYSTWYPETTGYSAGIVCTDLYTGQTEFTINTTSVLLCGMETQWHTPNAYGVIGPYLITRGTLPASETGGTRVNNVGAQYNMYSAFTGQYVLSIVNGSDLGPAMAIKTDDNGNLLFYYINSTVGSMSTYGSPPSRGSPPLKEVVDITTPVLCCFNMSQALGNAWGWAPAQNTVIDFGLGVMWAKPIPTEIAGVPIVPTLGISFPFNSMTGDAIVLFSSELGDIYEQSGYEILASMDDTTGQVLFCKNYTYPEYESLLPFNNKCSFMADGLRFMISVVNWKCDAIDVRTGTRVWETTLKTPYGDGTPSIFGTVGLVSECSTVISGTLFISTFGGDLWALDPQTGEELWYTNTTTLIGDPGIETPYGVWPLWQFTGAQAFTNDVAYITVGHEYNPPLFHGAQLLAINITDGKLIWSELGIYDRSVAIAQGILLALNEYDNQVYAYGKGPTATTVDAPIVGVTTDTPVVITGTVMDFSPGTDQNLVKRNFPYGLPCVSDESQSKWMEYVYQQQPIPTDVKGVLVTISVIDSNGNYYDIGTATTDTSGTFAFTWTPIIPGDFTVIATYAGSNSYYGSCAEAHFYASEAPQPTPAPTPVPQAPVETYFTVSTIAIIAAIAIAVVLLLRKK